MVNCQAWKIQRFWIIGNPDQQLTIIQLLLIHASASDVVRAEAPMALLSFKVSMENVLVLQDVALVAVDLQAGILGFPLAPHPGDVLVKNGARLAKAFRLRQFPVALTRVAWAADFSDALKQPVDHSLPMPEGGLPANWAEFAKELEVAPGDILITKRQWNAFHGTELDLQLRRRGVKTVVLAGVATNMGVESTARAAHELGYHLVFAEDAITSLSGDLHAFAAKTIFPMIGQVRSTDQILAALR